MGLTVVNSTSVLRLGICANVRLLAVIVRTVPTKSKEDNLTKSKLKNYARTTSLQSGSSVDWK